MGARRANVATRRQLGQASASEQRTLVERDVVTALTKADPTLVFTSGTFDQMLVATMTQERLVAMGE
jgi:hypothetical protein